MKLKPCPFCGGTDLKINDQSDSFRNKYARVVFCRDCHSHGPHWTRSGWTESDEQAAEAWNERADEQVDRVELAKIISQELFYLDWDQVKGVQMTDVMNAVQEIEKAGYRKIVSAVQA